MQMPANENQQLLSDAIERNTSTVLSIPSAGIVRHFKSRFVGADAQGIWIELPADARELLNEQLQRRMPLAVSFIPRNRRLTFVTDILRVDEQYKLNAETMLQAVLLAHPKELRGVQRRSNYRVAVAPESELKARIWIIGEQDPIEVAPISVRELKSEVMDLSVGGIGVRLLPSPAGDRKIVVDQRLRIELKLPTGESLLLDGRVRALRKGDDPSCLGIAFKKMDDTMDCRRALATLTRLVGELQRDEVRRVRRSCAA